MSKPKLPNQRKANQAHNARTEQYVRALDSVYDTFNKEAAKLSLITDYDGSAPFRWKDFPETKARLNKLMSGWTNSINTTIVNGVAAEWNEANINLDKVAKQALRRHKVNPGDKRYNKYFGNNESALKSFLARKDKGMNLSRKVWNMKQDYKEGLEAAISCGIDDGTSAVQLSKKISQYLKDFETLKGDYTEKFGSAADIKDCEYRSARLARSEINMAYHSAGQERWKDMDFVVGYEVKRSGGLDSEDSLKSYPCPVCEDLAGKYPKDFKFVGWHPNCRCYTIPILKTDEEFWAYDGRGEETAESANEVKDVPDNFKKWVVANKERIADAELHGTLPYFLRDNTVSYSSLFGELNASEISSILKSKQSIITKDLFSNGISYSQNREIIHDRIISEYLDKGNHTGSDTVYMLGGATANGKSTIVNSGKLPHPKGSLVIDADEIKAMIPEYGVMTKSADKYIVESAANFVHEESSDLGKVIRSKAFKKDLTVVIDGVNDGSFEKVQNNVNKIRSLTGKRVRADYCTLDTDLSVKLAKSRAEKTGRTVPMEYILQINRDVSRVIPKVIDGKTFDELYLWDTNINGNPRLILKQIDGKLTIFDKKLYDRFLLKGK